MKAIIDEGAIFYSDVFIAIIANSICSCRIHIIIFCNYRFTVMITFRITILFEIFIINPVFFKISLFCVYWFTCKVDFSTTKTHPRFLIPVINDFVRKHL